MINFDFLNYIGGAGDRNRTGTMSPSRDFKSRASASSATPAKKLEAPVGLEPTMRVLQTLALPLGDGASLLERKTGFEPATTGLGSQRSTPELLPHALTLYFNFSFSQFLFN